MESMNFHMGPYFSYWPSHPWPHLKNPLPDGEAGISSSKGSMRTNTPLHHVFLISRMPEKFHILAAGLVSRDWRWLQSYFLTSHFCVAKIKPSLRFIFLYLSLFFLGNSLISVGNMGLFQLHVCGNSNMIFNLIGVADRYIGIFHDTVMDGEKVTYRRWLW